ncbi:MAG: polysaccharide deacetylase [Clostridium sp.]|nr:polysaccharide deacetylase [Clostridium sp.]
METNDYRPETAPKRRRPKKSPLLRLVWSVPFLSSVLCILCVIAGVLAFNRGRGGAPAEDPAAAQAAAESAESASEEETTISAEEARQNVLDNAARMAAMYDYDGAIELLQTSDIADGEDVQAAIASYEETKATLVRQNPQEITHVFFHILVMDNSRTFDGDYKQDDYNQVMTTRSEFEKILEHMYARGFVLVRLHDIAKLEPDENGQMRMKAQDIMLPEGKKAFVMSQDDVCYYEYMEGDGFATKMVVGEDGRPTCEMPMPDGTIVTGDYDLVPILDHFIDEHPDFSYKGAKACLAFTGYNGILGYRTDPSYETNADFLKDHPDFNIEAERQEAMKVAACLIEDGYELASHSWGHRNMGTISMEKLIEDTNKWENFVAPLIGDTDIILFPFGSDIGDWHPYDTSSPRYQTLYNAGFRYFCNVDSNQYYVQIGDEYMRQGRRNLDGYRMYYDLPENNPSKQHLEDLFPVEEVFDRTRPVPVPPMGG